MPEGHFILVASTQFPQTTPLTVLREVQVGQTWHRLHMAQQTSDDRRQYEMRFVYEKQRGEAIELNEIYAQGFHTTADNLLTLTRQAGLTMIHAFGGFDREPYTAHSNMFIGVYRRADR